MQTCMFALQSLEFAQLIELFVMIEFFYVHVEVNMHTDVMLVYTYNTQNSCSVAQKK